MRRLAHSRISLPVARICRPPASQPYSTEGKNVDAKATTTSQLGAESSDLDSEELSGFDFGFDNWSEINPRDKTIETAAGALPISPLLDPAWREARQRKGKKIPAREVQPNRFQRRVKENPYAQLLTEPVRLCQVTRTRLPRPFLQSFGLVTHPETDQLWWMPGDFEQGSGEAAPEVPDENGSSAADDQLDSTAPGPADGLQEGAASQSVGGAADNPSSSPDPVLEATAASGPAAIKADPVAALDSVGSRQDPVTKQNSKFFAPVNMIARQDLMLEFLDSDSKYLAGYKRFAANPAIGKMCNGAMWREDMHEVIRDQMRGQIAGELVYLWGICEEKKERDYLIKVGSLETFKSDWNRFCCLFLGEGGLEPFETLEVANTAARAVPGYDLPTLLGPDIVGNLKSQASVFRDATVVVLKGKRTLDLQKKLWRLQGFVADYNKLL